jgi:hypothetical protein
MSDRRISAGWLSDEMAHALAAMCPPLKTSDVRQAADKLSNQTHSSRTAIGMFRPDLDPINVQKVVEALRALHDLVPEHAVSP